MFGLSFLSPLFLAGAAAAAVPIAIHLFYRRTDPIIDFAAMRYLRRTPVEQSHHRRLKELILLALRVAALVLLAIAFARPFLSRAAAALGAPGMVVVIDASASMSAPGQFERARTLAADTIRQVSAVGVISIGNGVDVASPLSSDRAAALAAVSRLSVSAGVGRYANALSRAAEVLADRPGRIVVVTDFQQGGWDGAEEGGVPERISVELKDAGSPEGNVAVTSLRAEAGQAVAVVQNYSQRVVTEDVVFAVGGREITREPITIGPAGSSEARISLSAQSSGDLSASISDGAGYSADNIRYMPLNSAGGLSILAVTTSGRSSEAFYLDRALAIAEGADGFRFRTVSGPMFSTLTPPALTDVNVLVIMSTRGLERRGRELLAGYVRSGGGLLLTAGPDVDPAVLREALSSVVKTTWQVRGAESLRLAPDDGRHPIFRIFGGGGALGNVEFQRTSLVAVPANAGAVARYTDGSAALVEEQTGSGRVLVFASDLNRQWNDFPLQPAFVPFIHELLRYAAAARTPRLEYFVGELPGPSGAKPGVVQLASAQGPGNGRRVAVNIDPHESDPTRMSIETFRANVARLHAGEVQRTEGQARDDEDAQRYWQYALLLMVVGLAAEGMLGRRLG
jgi:hypothetical protein